MTREGAKVEGVGGVGDCDGRLKPRVTRVCGLAVKARAPSDIHKQTIPPSWLPPLNILDKCSVARRHGLQLLRGHALGHIVAVTLRLLGRLRLLCQAEVARAVDQLVSL
jgi:hypothetical protein